MLIVDTGPLVALLNTRDPNHERCRKLFSSRTDDFLVTPHVVTEACQLVQKYVGPSSEVDLVNAVAIGDLMEVTLGPVDIARMAALMHQYRGFPLGVADASVIAAAERMRLVEVATLDRRHFPAVRPAHATAFELLP
jgi:predicted nucleic acid-binding protein